MNKVYIYVAVAVLLIGGAGAYFMLSNRTQAPGNTGTQNQQTQPSEKKSLKDLLTLGTAQNCTYTTPDGNGGNVMVSNGKMRGDFTTVTDSGSQKTHMIVDGQTSYFWMDNQSSGFKMSFDSSAQAAAGSSDSKVRAEGQMDADEKVDVDCSPWVVDSAVFSLPTNIKFTDFSSMIPNVDASSESEGTVGTDMKAQQCAACSSAPASAQAQCRAALGCE